MRQPVGPIELVNCGFSLCSVGASTSTVCCCWDLLASSSEHCACSHGEEAEHSPGAYLGYESINSAMVIMQSNVTTLTKTPEEFWQQT